MKMRRIMLLLLMVVVLPTWAKAQALPSLPHLNSWTYYPTVNAFVNQPPDGSGIEILRGFGAVPDGGSDIDVCIAFRNKGTKAATRIDMLYTMMAADGRTFGSLPFVRKGEFAPGADVQTFTFTQFATLGAPTNHGFWDNCLFHKTTTAPFFDPAMYLIVYRVTYVEYADGTSWSPLSSQHLLHRRAVSSLVLRHI